MSTAAILATRSQRLVFLGVMGASFLVLAAVALALPRQLTIVRTLVDSGFTEIDGKQEPFEQPDVTAQKIMKIYGPIALSELEKSGSPSSIIADLRVPEVEPEGLSLLIVNAVDARIENEAKAFQQSVADQIIKAQAPRAEAMRRTLAERTAAAKGVIATLDLQISSLEKEIEKTYDAGEDLKTQVEQQKAELAKFEQGSGSTEGGAISVAKLHLQGLIAAQAKSVGDLSVQRARLTRQLATSMQARTEQMTSLTDAQSEAATVTDARVSLPQLALPLSSSSRRYGLLFIAFVASVLVAFGAVALLHNLEVAKTARPPNS